MSFGPELHRQALASPVVAGKGSARPPTLRVVGIYRICYGSERNLLCTDNGPLCGQCKVNIVLELGSRIQI